MPLGAASAAVRGAAGVTAPAGGAITFVGAAYNSLSSSLSIGVDLSTVGLQANDLIIIWVTTGANVASTWDVPSGFTALTANLTNSNLHTSRGFYKQAAGSETTITATLSVGNAQKVQSCATVYRGVDHGTAPSTATATGSNASANPPARTTTVANEWVITGYSVNTPGGTFPTDAGGPAGFTVRLNRLNAVDIASGLADKEQVSPTTVDPDTFAWGGSTDDWVAFTTRVRPA